MDDAEARANAEFIVRAVNCHDELVAALNAVLPLAESKAGTDPSLPQWWRNAEMVKRVQQGRAALAHAKGYQP